MQIVPYVQLPIVHRSGVFFTPFCIYCSTGLPTLLFQEMNGENSLEKTLALLEAFPVLLNVANTKFCDVFGYFKMLQITAIQRLH